MSRNRSPDTTEPSPASSGPALRALSLRQNFSWSLLGNVVYAACQWLSLIVLAKLVPEEMVGRFAYGLAVAAPIVLFANLGLRQIVATDVRGRHAFADCLGLRLLTTPAALVLILGVAFLGDLPRHTCWVVAAVGLSKGIEALSDVFYGILQQRNRMDRIARSMISRGVLGLPALAVAVVLTGDVLWGVAAMALAWGGVLLLHDSKSASRVLGEPLVLRWDTSALSGIARRGFPLGVAVLMLNLNTNIPRYFIEDVLSEADLGVFSALAYLMAVGATFTKSMGQAAVPRLAQHYEDGNRPGYLRLLGALVGFAALGGGVGVVVSALFGRPILTLLYTPAYAERADVFTWLMLAAALLYVETFLGYGMTACQRFRVQPFLYGAAAGVLLGLCWWLIPRYGLSGAAWAVLLGGVFRILALAVIQIGALRSLPSPPDPRPGRNESSR